MKTFINLKKLKTNIIRYSLTIFGLILIISVTSSGLKSQSISTVREIYDYEVGDIFHIDFTGSYYGGGDNSITNIQILNKYYSKNNDTLYYIRDIDYKASSSTNPNWTYDYYIDTVFYFNLDSLINMGQIDTVYSIKNLYNDRLINLITEGGAELSITKRFVIGCGQAFRYYRTWGCQVTATTRLVYFKKGDEEWGTPLPVSIYEFGLNKSDLIVLPNPAKSNINIITDEDEIIDLKIIAMSGELIKSFKIRNESISIDVSHLKTGIYVLKITKKDRIIYKKLIKE